MSVLQNHIIKILVGPIVATQNRINDPVTYAV